MKNAVVLMLAVVAMAHDAYSAIITDMVVRAAADGSAMGAAAFYDDVAMQNSYPLGFTMYDKKGNTVFANQVPPGLGPDSRIVGYDGRVAVFNNNVDTQTFVYALSASGFTQIRTISGWIDGHPVLTKAETILPVDIPPATTYTLTSYDKKMRKINWSVVADGSFYWLGKSTFALQNGALISFIKKGTTFSSFVLSDPAQSCAFGAAGNLATWSLTDGTNGPITYITKNGTFATGMVLPEAGEVWSQCVYLNKDVLYVATSGMLNLSTVRAYKLGSSFTLLGSFVVEYLYEIELDGKTVVIHRDDSVNHGIIVTDAKLSKTIISTAMEPGPITSLGNGVFCRQTVSGSSVFVDIFNKKGIFVTHTFSLP